MKIVYDPILGRLRRYDGDHTHAAKAPVTHSAGYIPVWGDEDSQELEEGFEVVERIVTVPVNQTSSGIKGQEAYGGNYWYKCVATDTWVRTAVETTFDNS